MRLSRIARWISRANQLVPRPKPTVTNGVWPFETRFELIWYSIVCIAS